MNCTHPEHLEVESQNTDDPEKDEGDDDSDYDESFIEGEEEDDINNLKHSTANCRTDVGTEDKEDDVILSDYE